MESDINKTFTDEQIDDLIRQTFIRQETVEEINAAVMKQMRRDTRRRKLMRWGRIVAFDFGLPLILMSFGWMLWSFVVQQEAFRFSFFDGRLPFVVILLLPIVTMLYATWQAIEKFSPSDV